MNDDGTAPATDAPAEGAEDSTTPAEVAAVLNLPKDTPAAPEEPSDPKAPKDSPDTPDDDPTPDDPNKPGEPEAPKAEPPKPAEPEAPADAPTFTVEIEDAQGKKFTVGPDDNLEDVLAEFEPKNNGQVLQLMRDLDRLGNERQAHEEKQATEKTENEKAEMVKSIQDGWDKEVVKLQGEKRIPVTADGKQNERVEQIFKFMAEANEKRIEAGMPPISTLEDALDKLENKERREADVEAKKKAKEDARTRGGLVGGSSAPASSGSPVYQAGTAKNATEAARAMGLL